MLNFFKKNKNIKNDNGLNEIYSKNGKGDLMSEFTRVNGVIEGEAIHYHEDGSIKKIENYKSGKLDGLTKIYDTFGVEIIDELNYVNGEIVASKKDIELKNKFESIKDFMLKTRLIDLEFKVDFLEISQMSDETIKSKSKELSESSKYDTEDIFYYLTYKRMFGIENFLNESEKNDFDQTGESLFAKVDESFRENIKKIILEMNKRRTFFDKNGVYNDGSMKVKSNFTPELGWSYWRDNYSSLKNIYKYSRYNWTSTYLRVDEYLNHLKNTTSELFYLKPSQYLDLKILFHQANQVKITHDKDVDDERKDNLNNYIKNIIDGNINVEVNCMNFSIQLLGIVNNDFSSLRVNNINPSLKSKMLDFHQKHEDFLMKREFESQGITQEDIENETDEFIESFGVLELLYEDIEGRLDKNLDLGTFDDKKPINKKSFEYYTKKLCLKTDGLIIVKENGNHLEWPVFIAKYINQLDPEYLDEKFKKISFEEFIRKSSENWSKHGCSISSLVCYTNE